MFSLSRRMSLAVMVAAMTVVLYFHFRWLFSEADSKSVPNYRDFTTVLRIVDQRQLNKTWESKRRYVYMKAPQVHHLGNINSISNIPRSDPRFTAMLEKLKVANPVISDPLQASLQHGAVVIDPDTGTPMKSDVFVDIQRIREKQRKKKRRPATKEDIDATLKIVREKVAWGKSNMTTESFRNFKVGVDKPFVILLVTTWRSGSTFLGQLIADHEGVFNHYEPLSYIGLKQVRDKVDTERAKKTIASLSQCDYNDMNEYLDYCAKYPDDMISHNLHVYNSCRRGPNTNTCLNATFLHDSCMEFPIHIFKLVRVRLSLAAHFLQNSTTTKIVYLVRDPRGIMNSRMRSVGWCDTADDCIDHNILCRDVEKDLRVAAELQKEHPGQVYVLKYEDVARDPFKEALRLYKFLGLEFNERTRTYLSSHTRRDVNSPWSTIRKSADRAELWKTQLTKESIKDLQQVCMDVIKLMKYDVIDV